MALARTNTDLTNATVGLALTGKLVKNVSLRDERYGKKMLRDRSMLYTIGGFKSVPLLLSMQWQRSRMTLHSKEMAG